MSRWAMIMGVVLLFAGCASGPRRVSEGWLQKRQHRPGWHVDLGGRSSFDAERHRPRMVRMELRSPGLPLMNASAERHPLSSRVHVQPEPAMHAEAAPAPDVAVDVVVRSPVLQRASTDQEDLMPHKRWNRLAVPAFAVSLGAVALALFTTSTIAVIAALVVALVLAGISIRQIRWREERGKGFAIAALMIAVIAAIVTAMVTAVVGFV